MSNYPRIDRPTEPGWYWLRLYEGGPWEAVSVNRSGTALGLCRDPPLWYDIDWWQDRYWGISWRGPIPEPQE